MLLAVVSGFVGSALAPVLVRRTPRAAAWLLAVLPATLTVYFAWQASAVVLGEIRHVAYPWVPSTGLSLSFQLDGLSLLFSMLVTGVGTLVLVYAGQYLRASPRLGYGLACLMAFMASMLGLVLADNILTLFVFWELTSLISFLLIGLESERAAARAAALQSLLVTAGGGLALLAGLLLLGHVGGSYELSTLAGRGHLVREHALYLPVLLLVLAGAFTKSAQMPFHFWLPNAMEAPTPVSAYLHSATMVKAGVYLLARLSPVLGGTVPWVALVTVVGAVTTVGGALLAVAQTHLKRLLAYSTVSALGLMTLLIGVGTAPALLATMVLLVAHACYKGALFLVAGTVGHEVGESDESRLGGLARAMPFTAVAGGLAALSMIGVPPLLGFVGKELALEAAGAAGSFGIGLQGAMVLTMALLTAVAVVVGVTPFVRARPSMLGGREGSPALWSTALVLALAGLIGGLVPSAIAPLVGAAASAAANEPVPATLAGWHGVTPLVVVSGLAVAAGLALVAHRPALLKWYGRVRRAPRGPASWYDAALGGLATLARVQTGILQNGYLRYYLLMIVLTAVGLVGLRLASAESWGMSVGAVDVHFHEAALALVIPVAAVAAVRSRSRLGAIAALGVVGYGVSLVYLMFGAPDLAMTQFVVETLTVILFVLVFYHLPAFASFSSRRQRWRDLMVAGAAGALMSGLVYAAVAVQVQPAISDYYLGRSLPDAHGRNVVNVILVDFRAIDTLGEISVLVLAAVGVYALVKLRPSQEVAS